MAQDKKKKKLVLIPGAVGNLHVEVDEDFVVTDEWIHQMQIKFHVRTGRSQVDELQRAIEAERYHMEMKRHKNFSGLEEVKVPSTIHLSR